MGPSKTGNHEHIRILYLEGKREDPMLALMALKRAGVAIEAQVVSNESEFKDSLPEGQYDLVLSEFSLPGWCGVEALRWVRRSGSITPFIYVSGTLREDLAVECLKEGATDYVVKNSLDRVPSVVCRALEEGWVRGERDQAISRLKESEERFATTFRSTPEGVTISRLSDGPYLEANDALLRTLGYEKSEIIGKTALELGIWAEPSARTGLMKKLEMAEFVHAHPAKFRTHTGEVRFVEISAGRIELQGTLCLLAITRDVTELRSLQQQFLQAQKMEAVGRLAAGV